MTILISPTKQMNFTKVLPEHAAGSTGARLPVFVEKAVEINKALTGYDKYEIGRLMSVSPALAEKTVEWIAAFGTPGATSRPALFTYSGTVFETLNPYSLDKREIMWADEHLRILSAYYGCLRPLDRISPYRLEMKCSLPLAEGDSLTSFWKKRIREVLADKGPVLNLASKEYAKVLDRKVLGNRVINLIFKERIGGVGGRLRTVGMYAKVARGLMLRRIILEQPDNPEHLKKGDTGGYIFSPSDSSSADWVFARNS